LDAESLCFLQDCFNIKRESSPSRNKENNSVRSPLPFAAEGSKKSGWIIENKNLYCVEMGSLGHTEQSCVYL